LWALAIGPLFALTFLALQSGKELKNWEDEVKQWEQDKLKYFRDAEALQVRRERQDKKLNENATFVKVATLANDWRKLTHSEKLKVADMTPKKIGEMYPISNRTPYNWLEKAIEYKREVGGVGNRPPLPLPENGTGLKVGEGEG